jgi:hypothetical protein
LAYKGDPAHFVSVALVAREGDEQFRWEARIERQQQTLDVRETLQRLRGGAPPEVLMESHSGEARWWSAQGQGGTVRMSFPKRFICALPTACADEGFPARALGPFLERCGFYDPSPPLARRAADGETASRLDAFGRNLPARLFALSKEKPRTFDRIVRATRDVLGVPDKLDFRESEYDGRVYFVQTESGLAYPVHQVGASSGTLRMLALMTALLGEEDSSLVGIEEPENHVHPSALEAFASLLRDATDRAQILVTTHSPLVLDVLAQPEEVCVVRRGVQGTTVARPADPDGVRKALHESGFGLGQFFETTGFGA